VATWSPQQGRRAFLAATSCPIHGRRRRKLPGQADEVRQQCNLLFFALGLDVSDYYNLNAASFIETTRDVDMSEARGRFLASVPSRDGGPARILDAGSGSGRDARAFRLLGHDVEAFDASPAMVAATQSHAAVPTRLMHFEDFAWEHPFEGIWACASLLHVAEVDLAGVIDRLAAHIVPGGALYTSFKRGTGERVKDGRRFTDMTADSLAGLLDRCGAFSEPDIWDSRDCRPDRASEVWVNSVVNKT
jgi:SAM-dependent methyltransferase